MEVLILKTSHPIGRKKSAFDFYHISWSNFPIQYLAEIIIPPTCI